MSRRTEKRNTERKEMRIEKQKRGNKMWKSTEETIEMRDTEVRPYQNNAREGRELKRLTIMRKKIGEKRKRKRLDKEE